MTEGKGARRPPAALALLAAAVLSVTALVRVPIELYRAAAPDFVSASRDLVLAVVGAGLAAFVLLALAVTLLPAGRRHGGPLLVGLAAYAWIRSGFFPGPSVTLDGSALTADLSTGWAGLVVPLAGGVLLAVLGARQPRVTATLLAVLLAGSVVQSLLAAASAWKARPPASGDALASLQEWSRRGNVLVLVLDSLQSDVLEDVLEAEPRLRDELDGFRHYRLASSNGPTTYLSLPTIHGGRPYEPGRTAAQFYREAVYEGSVLNRLAGAGYRTSYAVGIGDCPRSVATCTSTAALARSRVEVVVAEAGPLLDLGVYRVLPDGLRESILGSGRGPLTRLSEGTTLAERAVGEAAALQRLAAASTTTDSPPTAKIVHSMVTHLPAVLLPDCSTGERRFDREAARLQAQCALRRVVALLERLRRDGTYDVTSIVVVADHGYGFESRFVSGSQDPKFRRMVGAFNPAVLVKPAGARGPLASTDVPVELADVPRALCGEAGCSPGEGLRRLDDVDARRTRAAFWYTWNHRYWALPQIPGLVRYSIRGDLPRVESWSREATAYEPGTVIEFRRGGNLGDYVGFGWGHRGEAHTRMVDAEATLWLKGRFDSGRAYLLVLEAETAPKRVTVKVNDVEIGQIVSVSPAPRVETYRFTVPASVLSRSPETLIRFLADGGSSAVGDSPAAHLALKTLVLRPVP